MTKEFVAPVWQRALVILTSTVVGVVALSCLYLAQRVLIPLALAVFLTFLLAPLVTILQRRGLGRTPSVILVVMLAAVALGGAVWLVTAEVTSLARDLPAYTENIKGKIRSLRQMGPGAITDHLEKMVEDITGEWKSKHVGPEGGASEPPAAPVASAQDKPSAVLMQPDSSPWLAPVPAVLRSVVEAIGGLALALVLVVFMLLKREDLRNRLIRLVGHGRLTEMTNAVDDAGRRISRYLVMQVIINGSYGAAFALGLLLIQVPNALLWGFLAALLRYVPYFGMMITSGVVLILSLAAFPGWLQPCLVLALLVVLELATYNVLEPWLFSQSTGISEVAVLVAAAFWAFLWGPVGLILSNPLTVCLVVLGKYVAPLEFLNVLLGDAPALEADVTYYQRLLARDQDEATQLVLAKAKSAPPEQVYDELLIAALNCLKRDRARDDLADADEQFVLRATREILDDLGQRQVTTAAAPEENGAPARPQVRILGCPGHDEADRLALEMLRQLLDPTRWVVDMLPLEMLSSELVARAGEKEPAVVCLGALPPGGLAHTRYLCKRLRARLPHAKILVGRWGLKANVESDLEELREAGADQVATNLVATRDYLTSWLPVLAPEEAQPTKCSAPGASRLAAV